MRVLVTGATGYIGGRLVPRLLDAGHQVRVFVRDRSGIVGRRWAHRVEVTQGDLLVPATLEPAMEGIGAAYYLVHSMSAGAGFAERDRRAAAEFVHVARGVKRVVYLGGLQPAEKASNHLASRAEVGAILRRSLPTTELRAGPVIGSGSASFEMVRYLTERLPVMVAPRWVQNEVQPIDIRDLLAYLVQAIEREPAGVVDIGGDRLTFAEMLLTYADVRKLARRVVSLPWLLPTVGAWWVGMLTPIPNAFAVPLIQGMVHPVVADTTRARELFPSIRPATCRESMERALRRVRGRAVETRWSGALGGGKSFRLVDREGLVREERTRHVTARPEHVYDCFTQIGGERGWLVWEWAWAVRGLVDRIAGGPGLRRGRRDPLELLPGEAIDFWRVEEAERPSLLRLRAEMKLPGAAWLQWETRPEAEGTRLVQTAIFEPMGLAGALYWYGLYPIHAWIFSDLVRAIAREAEK